MSQNETRLQWAATPPFFEGCEEEGLKKEGEIIDALEDFFLDKDEIKIILDLTVPEEELSKTKNYLRCWIEDQWAAPRGWIVTTEEKEAEISFSIKLPPHQHEERKTVTPVRRENRAR